MATTSDDDRARTMLVHSALTTEIVPPRAALLTKETMMEEQQESITQEQQAALGAALASLGDVVTQATKKPAPKDPVALINKAWSLVGEREEKKAKKTSMLAGPRGSRAPLSRRELAMCREKGIDPAAYAAKRDQIKRGAR